MANDRPDVIRQKAVKADVLKSELRVTAFELRLPSARSASGAYSCPLCAPSSAAAAALVAQGRTECQEVPSCQIEQRETKLWARRPAQALG